MSTALLWFRRDLRLYDNPALSDAVTSHERVIPVYVHAPEEEAPWTIGQASGWWLHQSLAVLDKALRKRGSGLVLRGGSSLASLRTLVKETGATAVYWNRLYEPAVIARDKVIKAALDEDGLEVASYNAALLVEPWTVHKDDGNPYQVFTAFWKACLRFTPPPNPLSAPARIGAPCPWPASLPLASLSLLPPISWYTTMAKVWQPGEEGAMARLNHFCEASLADYSHRRNLPGTEGVSRLSPHLHFGELSPRQVWTAVTNQVGRDPLAQPAAEAFLRELGWREFAHYVLYHWPHTPESPLQERFKAFPWRTDYDQLLRAWQQGQTGYPLVDAGMRELWQTGWMHNRVRMIVASFLTKNCRIPWQEGTRWFWDTLVDADLANNTLGWQWTAGCGTDAAPYFRLFNPATQAMKFDPDGTYVRRWVPEIAGLSNHWLYQPWAAPLAEQGAAHLKLGIDYPYPLVDLRVSRSEALAGYERIKRL
jgi:deoxyribodipyrimidine photo-lyase